MAATYAIHKRVFQAIFGEFAWTPPAWMRYRRGRRTSLAVLAVGTLLAGGYWYYQSLPVPLVVRAGAMPPTLAPIEEGELKPQPLRVSFEYAPNPDVESPPALSAARLDLLGHAVESGIDMQPPHPGEWRFETENVLVFTPRQDWPAGRGYRIRLRPELFAPGVTLASEAVSFTTPAFAATLEGARLHQHPEQAEDRRVLATWHLTHPVSRASLESRVRVERQSGQGEWSALAHEVEYEPLDRQIHIRSEIVAIEESEYAVRVTIDEGVEPALGVDELDAPLEAQVRVPSRSSYFRVDELALRIVEDADGRAVQTAVFSLTDQVRTADFGERVRAWLLPEKRSESDADMYHWRSPMEVIEAVRQRAEPLPLVVNPTERDSAALQSVAFDAPEGRYVYFRIAAGLRSAGGFSMAKLDGLGRAPNYPKQAAIAQDGALLPLTGERRLTLTARGVATIRVVIQQIHADALNHLASQTGGNIRDPWFHGWRFDADNIATRITRDIDVKPAHPGERVFASLDMAPFLADGGLFIVTAQGWDRQRERAIGESDRRLALITDLGLMAKTNRDLSQHVFVHSIATGQPVAGAQVDLLGKNGLAVQSALTDENGHAALATTNGLEHDRAPTVFVVRHGGDAAFMPYRRGDRRLSWRGFDVGGEEDRPDPAGDGVPGLTAFIHTDRGLYRPGEAVRLFAIVRRRDFSPVPDAPLELRVTDSRGAVVLRQRDASPPDGLFAWRFQTRRESPTGRYRASVHIVDDGDHGEVLGEVLFSVEDYRPDQLRIRTEIEDAPSTSKQGWVAPGTHTARVSLANLFGTPAQNRRVRGTVVLTPASPRFDSHPDFVFTDPHWNPDAARKAITLTLDETRTDAAGVARLPFDLSQYQDGVYQLLVTAEGFESDSGRGVKAVSGTLLSAATVLIGHKADGDLGFIAKDGGRNVAFVAIGADGEATERHDLQAVLVERRYVSALVRQPGGAFAYQSVLKESELSRAPVALPAELALPTDTPGEFALELVDAEGIKLSRVEFSVAGERNLAGNLERDAELQLKLDRSEYAPGDEIVMEITAPYAGTGLVTIERDRVHAFKWLRSETNTTMARIRVPPALEGNAYVNVAFVRDLDSPEIFVSPLSYAVAPFQIARDARRLDLELTVPEIVRPGTSLAVGYRANVAARLILMAVDEGILQVAKHRSPQPLDAFLRKKALQVETHQMVDLILPDYNVLRRLAAPGGGDAARLLGANLNPFQRRGEPPLAFFSGIVEADHQQREVRFDVPDYFNGELRVMAVGVGESRMGAATKPVTVRGPMVLTPSLPVTVAPGDVFDVSVTVANNVAGSGDDAGIALAADPSAGLTVESDAEIALPVGEGGESRANFRVRAGDAPGAVALTLVATLGEEQVRRRTSLSIRPAVPFATTVTAGFSASDATIELPRRLHDSFAERRVLASASPLALADGIAGYLAGFPHECAEQIVSKVFPQIGLLRAGEGSALSMDRAAFDDLFEDTVAKLRPRQQSGGFRFWLGSPQPAPFVSVYITHFLADAANAGASVPPDMLRAAMDFVASVASETLRGTSTLDEAHTRAYAIYLLTRDGAVTTNYLAALQVSLEGHFPDDWRNSMAAAYMAASHALLHNEELATELIDGYRLGGATSADTDLNTRLGRDAQYAYLVARHFPHRRSDLEDAIPALVSPIFDNRFNTLSAAYTVLALAELHVVLADAEQLALPTIGASTESGAVDVAVTGNAFGKAQLPVAAEEVHIAPANGLGVYYAITESGFDKAVPTEALAQGLELDRAYLDAGGEPVAKVRVGDEVTVRLRVRSLRGWVDNVAITDLLPGGLEIMVDSVRDGYGGVRLVYRDVREDRLVLYGRFGTAVTEIRYRAKAVAPGDFAAPAAYAEAMYHRDVKGRSEAGRLIVESG